MTSNKLKLSDIGLVVFCHKSRNVRFYDEREFYFSNSKIFSICEWIRQELHVHCFYDIGRVALPVVGFKSYRDLSLFEAYWNIIRQEYPEYDHANELGKVNDLSVISD